METQTSQSISLDQAISIILRRKALIATCILLAVSLGLARYLTQPKTYEGIALLSYQQQKINPTKMSPDEQAKIKDIVSTLSEIVLSRTSLEKIIRKEDLFKNLLDQLPLEDVMAIMRRNIEIAPSRKGDTFTVRYQSTNSQKVARVTNALASAFIIENMKYREEKAAETSDYTQDELEMAKIILDRKESVMRDYKLKHYNEMPEQRIVNMTRLASLQSQYQSKQESIQELERTKVLIRDQIAIRKQLLNSMSLNSIPSDTQETVIETDLMKLQRLNNNLIFLQDKYTNKHPKIKSLKKNIDRLTAQIDNSPDLNHSLSPKNNSQDNNYDPTLLELQAEIKGIELSIQTINKEKEETLSLIKQYEKWISATPVREAEWSALTREYGETKRHYDYLVSQNLAADSALNLERKQKGSQFKIVDPAISPIKPIKPDFIRIMKIVLLGGSALAGGLIVCLEFLDTTFRDPKKISQDFNLDIICSIPHLALKKELKKKQMFFLLGTLFFSTWFFCLLGAMYYLNQQGLLLI